jgi:hypothetical protein
MHIRNGSYAANRNILLEMAAMLHIRTFYADEYDLFFMLLLYTTHLNSHFHILSTDFAAL